jgi:hypothetical protein
MKSQGPNVVQNRRGPQRRRCLICGDERTELVAGKYLCKRDRAMIGVPPWTGGPVLSR